MKFLPLPACALALPVLVFAACAGGTTRWGEEMSRETATGEATIYRTDAVEPDTAATVLRTMVELNYNFGSDLPEQIDRVDGRLTLRLVTNNEDTIGSIRANGEDDGAVWYHRELARRVSHALGGEPVDVVLCAGSLDEPFYTMAWEAPAE